MKTVDEERYIFQSWLQKNFKCYWMLGFLCTRINGILVTVFYWHGIDFNTNKRRARSSVKIFYKKGSVKYFNNLSCESLRKELLRLKSITKNEVQII